MQKGEFPEIKNREQFAELIDSVMKNATETKTLERGRKAWWDATTGTVVIHNPNANDEGTAFRPTRGKDYFDGLQ